MIGRAKDDSIDEIKVEVEHLNILKNVTLFGLKKEKIEKDLNGRNGS